MKAIILAAGLGTRLGKYTENLPKCMLSFNGRPLIEWQVETLRKGGVTDISIVKGYMAEKIRVEGVKYYTNEDYAATNMVDTLFAAEAEMDDELVVLYSDILYEPRVLKDVLKSKADIGVAVDCDYLEYWKARLEKPEEDTESLVIADGKIAELGETKCAIEKAKVRYVGIIKFSKTGCETLKKIYHENKTRFFDKDIPWLRSKSFKRAYMTCMLQAIINAGYEVNPIMIKRGWIEFDTVGDYEKYTEWKKDGTLKRFISI